MKKLLSLFLFLFLSTSVFALDKFVTSYQVNNNKITETDFNGYSFTLSKFHHVGYHAELIWDKVSVDFGIVSFYDIYIDAGYNFINTDKFFLSAGIRTEYSRASEIGIGLYSNADGFLKITTNWTLDLGITFAGIYYSFATNNELVGKSDEKYKVFAFDINPRFGTCIKL